MLVVSILLLAAFTQFITANTTKDDIDDAVPPIFFEDEQKIYHFATKAEIEDMKNKIGVKDPDINYNIIVNGKGTGFSPPTESAWNSFVDSLVIVDEIKSPVKPLQSSHDLSLDVHFPVIGDQGWQGSCSAWAMAYYTYGYLEAKDQGWGQASNNDVTQLVSPAWTYNKVNGGNDWGSSTWDNGLIIKDWGAATLSTMSYDDTDHLDWGDAVAFREAPLHRGNQLYYLGHDASVNDIKTLIDSGIPITFGIDADQYDDCFADGNYIISSVEYDPLPPNHAQTIVGYDDNINDDGEFGAFRIANSWGTLWGDQGFYWLTYDAFLDIGDNELLYLTYMDDIPDYKPSLLATWHFNDAPTRDASITLGVGTHNSPLDTKAPHYESDIWRTMPTYMSLDVTEFQNDFDNDENRFFLHIGISMGIGEISSYKLEHYEYNYVPGKPTQVSLQSPDVPKYTNNHVTNELYNYTFINSNEALDNHELIFTTGGVAAWAGVNHESFDWVDSMQSGDVGHNGVSYIETSIMGPASVSWHWKIDADEGDILLFKADLMAVDHIWGYFDWHEKHIDLHDNRLYALRWEFSKDGSTSSSQDAAWLDHIQVYDISEIHMIGDPQADNWEFLSLNLIPKDTYLPNLLYDIDGNYDRVMYYDAFSGRWQSYVPFRSYQYNNLLTWNHTMGVWIRVISANTLIIRGKAPSSTDITLYPGWNMIGYPSVQEGSNQDIDLIHEITTIGFFEPATTYNVGYTHDTMNFVFETNKGYWLYNIADYTVIWTVTY